MCIETISIASIIFSLNRFDKIDAVAAPQPYQDYIIKRLLLYMAAFWIIWFPSLLNRFYTAFTGNANFGLAAWQAISSPSQGMIQFLAFLYTW